MTSEFPPIEELLPHEDPMVLIDRLEAWSNGGGQAIMRVRADTRFVEGRTLATPFLLEHMAQTIAACLGYEAYQDGRGVKQGMIINCKTFTAHVPATEVGDELTLEARREQTTDALSRYSCSVHRGSEPIADSTMTLFHGDLPD